MADFKEYAAGLAEQLPAALALVDATGRIVASNPAFAAMFGDPGASDPRGLAELVDPGVLVDFLQQMSALVKGELPAFEISSRYRGARGDERWMHLRCQGMGGARPGLFFALIDDIGYQMDENLALRRDKEAAEQATRSKSTFLANMSHEIRTPIHTVTGMTQLLLETSLDTEQQEYVRQIRFSAEVLLGLINDILDFSKIEAGRLNLEIIDFDLVRTIEEAVDMQCLEAFQKGLEIVIQTDPGIPRRLRGDPVRIRQIITNLLSNALKFTARGEISLRLELLARDEQSASIRCAVSDTGIGIPDDKLDRLFQSFSQVDASMTRRFGGTGLGLSICRSLINMMGGEIHVESAVGAGSRFWFELPLPQAEGVAPAAPAPAAALGGQRVLVVDDNRASRAVVRGILAGVCREVQEAEDAKQGLARLAEASRAGQPFDIALVDMQMPGMDGWQFASEVNADKAINGTRLFLMNPPGKMGADAKMKLLNWFDDYIAKPIKRDELLQTLASSLESSLDLSVAEPEAGAEVAKAPGQAAVPGTGAPADPDRRFILVAEDHFVNQKLFKVILERIGCRVALAANGLEALAIALEQQPDLVFMDVQMPEMNGYEATQALRQANFRKPVIAVTANALKGDQEKCLQAGMNDYLPKPFQRSDVEAMLGKWLEGGGARPAEPAEAAPKAGPQAPGPATEGAAGLAEAGPGGPLLDARVALNAFMQDGELLKKVMREYCRRLPEQLDSARVLVADGALDKAVIVVHTIKGSSWSLGVTRLGNAAGAVERACAAGDAAAAARLLPELERTWRASQEPINRFLED